MFLPLFRSKISSAAFFELARIVQLRGRINVVSRQTLGYGQNGCQTTHTPLGCPPKEGYNARIRDFFRLDLVRRVYLC